MNIHFKHTLQAIVAATASSRSHLQQGSPRQGGNTNVFHDFNE